jgi:hypothetical protein
MSYIPPNYLSKKQGRYRELKLLDVVTLLYNIQVGARHKRVGFEDSMETLESITKKLSVKKLYIDPSVLESALWSCNLMDECDAFWDPKGRSFEQFLKEVLGRDSFDRFFNVIERKEDK